MEFYLTHFGPSLAPFDPTVLSRGSEYTPDYLLTLPNEDTIEIKWENPFYTVRLGGVRSKQPLRSSLASLDMARACAVWYAQRSQMVQPW